jgi:hypothetical protein
LFGWVEEQVATTQIVTIGDSPYMGIDCVGGFPFNKGASFHLTLPSSDPNLRRVRLRSNTYSGIFLNGISGLGFSTKIVYSINHSTPAMALQIDHNLDANSDFNLVFVPSIQHSQNEPGDGIKDFPQVIEQIWQNWNALDGWWLIFQAPEESPFYQDTFTIRELLYEYPDARIVNRKSANDDSGGSIRFTVGGDDPDHADFDGYIDNFYIGFGGYYTVLYNFETGCQLHGNEHGDVIELSSTAIKSLKDD